MHVVGNPTRSGTIWATSASVPSSRIRLRRRWTAAADSPTALPIVCAGVVVSRW